MYKEGSTGKNGDPQRHLKVNMDKRAAMVHFPLLSIGNEILGQAWYFMLLTTALRRLRQESYAFQIGLGYMRTPVSKTNRWEKYIELLDIHQNCTLECFVWIYRVSLQV